MWADLLRRVLGGRYYLYFQVNFKYLFINQIFMQTINEAAKSVYKETTTHDEEVAFKRGVEFAQQWIPIEKYLPVQNESDYQILVEIKDSKYCPYEVITIPFAGSDFDFWKFSRLYTQWRPISFL